MRQFVLIFSLIVVSLMNVYPQPTQKFGDIWDKEHISTLFPSDVRHADLKKYLEKLKKTGVKVDQVGFSKANREIFQLEWGKGPLRIFMWSQMHGDEPTATSALIDLFAVLQNNRERDWAKRIAETVTIRAVPMLNPDGQELYRRRNLQDIDLNRDALELRTPEARILKQLRDSWSPAIGFNLHNQNALTTAGRSARQAAISLLVVYGDAAKTTSYGHERNQRLAAAMANSLQKFIPGHIARYSDEWTPAAFGDNFSAWGTPTLLIETGALHGKDELYLVKMNFIAFMTALDAIATGGEKTQDVAHYLMLPENSSGGLVNLIIRNATIIDNGEPIGMNDIASVSSRMRTSYGTFSTVKSIGALPHLRGLDEYDAAGFYVAHRFGRMRIGELAEFFFYKKDRIVDWTAADLEKQFPPDAIFSLGKWAKGAGVIPKK